MTFTISSVKTQNISAEDLLYRWVSRQVNIEALNWLNEKRESISNGAGTRVFFTAFSAVPRYTSKNDIQPTVEELESAANACNNWFPDRWTIDQAARTLLVLSLPSDDANKYLQILSQVFAAADVGELVALYQALPLLPYPEQLCDRAAEGIRSNMTAVFNAVALQNPYPAEYLDNLAWNQMVLKALFVGSPLHLIQGLDERANPDLARMLVDYARERWAAGRDVSPELWRCVGRFANSEILADLERVLIQSHAQAYSNGRGQQKLLERTAAALACAECPLPQAQFILEQYPELQSDIQAGRLTWKNVR
ncbi:EboA family metabolite traffic protein [Rivularia sp. UHCC 0363]|uniref:EboA family metabolite traffic protein n=1 Tax=Rivularia sp. UHCC 0363 TaxID=3110244 RepID=UPI002B20B438|nr:EboA family metabolite traffic protein [Rivularia sp. UHCC 0363]MEA5594955.1 EboA family metabolite traffic protein [Rivularia sp. UHCC 0363]